MKKSNSSRFIRVIAMILVAIMWVGTMVGLAYYAINAANTPSTPASATVHVHVEGDEDTKKLQATEPEEELRVLLKDASGSMSDQLTAFAGYDEMMPFSDYLGDTTGNSQIVANIVRTLRLGVKELGVMTDLESWPASDLNAADGMNFEGVELTFFVSDDAAQKDVTAYKEIFSKVLNPDDSTLIFVMADGTKEVVFDNYGKDANEAIIEDEEKKDQIIDIDVETTAGEDNGIDKVTFALVLMLLTTIIFALIEAILALYGRDNHVESTDVPGGIQDALKNTTALDGSTSVSGVYTQLVQWAKAQGVSSVYRFAGDVERLSIDEAAKRTAEGQTHGWACLKELYDCGEKNITIVSDMKFNDLEDVSLSFDSITFVVPAGTYSQEILDKVAALAISHKVIEL